MHGGNKTGRILAGGKMTGGKMNWWDFTWREFELAGKLSTAGNPVSRRRHEPTKIGESPEGFSKSFFKVCFMGKNF